MQDVLQAAALSVEYHIGREAVRVFHGLDMSVAYGEVVAVVGPSGSGKSSLLRVLTQQQQPSSGAIRYYASDGSECNSCPDSGLVYQDYRLIPFLTAVENVQLAAQLKRGRADRAEAIETLDRLRVGHLVDRRPAELSGGEQQRVAVARALATGARFVVADEPTGALDEASSAELAGLLLEVARRESVAVVIATHDPVVWGLADRVVDLAAAAPMRTTESAHAD